MFLKYLLLIFTTRHISGEVIDPTADKSTTLREMMRGKHKGVTITSLVLDFTKEFFAEKYKNFEELTGAKINVIESNTATWYEDVLSDVTDYESGLIDLYTSFGNWVAQFSELGGFLDITENISQAAGLDWFDIMPAVRNGVATYKKKVFAVPIDGDVILMLYRRDLVEDVGLPTPNTWDDVLEILDYYKDKDGLYGNCLPTAQNDISGEIFFSIASSFLQTKGTSEGVFFDPDTMEPVSSYRKDEFVKILDLYKKIVHNSPFRDSKSKGVDWINNLSLFNEGKCVLWYNYPGPTRIIISNQKANNMSGVLDLAPLPGMKCEDCIFASEDNANHAPYLASGGMCLAVNNRTSKEKQAAALDLAFYMSDPGVSYWDVAFPGSFLDPLRQRHTVSLSNNETKESQSFLSYGWENRQLEQLRKTTEFNFFHENYVYDLKILGANEYREDGLIPYLQDHWNDLIPASETADMITKSWNVITEKYGLIQQRNFYRNVLDLPPYIPDQSWSPVLIISLTMPLCILVLILSAVVLKQRHVIKYKTRDVNSAPKSGQVALLFTDIEGSTSLWDSSKSSMSKALEIHHNVIRECIDKYRAYEVKTIGDAFMIATDSADKACLLANDIQTNLLKADWPLELATHPSSCVSYFMKGKRRDNSGSPPKPMFKGLRIRIGIHIGNYSPELDEGNEVQIMYDKVTKGYDYYGPVSNTAARIESVGFGGQTIISREIFTKLSQNVKETCAISPIGEMELRGVTGAKYLYQLLPIELQGRVFNGAYRKRDSVFNSITEQISDDGTHGEMTENLYEQDKYCNVYSLTPVELQNGWIRMQARISNLERELRKLASNTSCDDTNMISELSYYGNEIIDSEVQSIEIKND